MTTKNKKVIVITGASSGIGKATAILAAESGMTPVLLARSVDTLRALADNLQHSAPDVGYYRLDVTKDRQIVDIVQKIICRYGKIDIWVNNAGFGIFAPFSEAKLEDIANMMDVNYLGTVRCTKAVLPHMLGQKSGHIINVASVAGKLATPKSSGYTASKFAVVGFTESLRQELKGSGVSISLVNPGPVQTPFFERADQNGEYRRSVEAFMLPPETVAKSVLRTIHNRKAEAIIPRYMRIGVILFHLFPRFFDRVIAPRLNKK
ncbi:SDR family oxidoreductase [Aneurinibacillus thermoaerophilus]|uniref:SDR family oxidoreductase n=1 Tax=Aneurinibacillus thermoaerophilus TaxID=143495 RepID=UPI002E230C9F|nr:SDR family oxidoreductase [Aneurinibacillus thermoaerophilus]MED0676633.1 SDR family oxidoreductase [Aneurinibacillus thermoaerophilus]